ncbi:MAG: DegT/DnrJ/EryC1/StrS family aminotransferase [Deltaproteobacteria bacterium]|nr:DegT/DnrJ/EryC1/StrS family aminotransferase [Deltaproteobacteria bacterium]
MPIPLLDIARTHAGLEAAIEDAMARVFRSGAYVLGPEVASFEAEVAAWLGVEHAVGVSSGTDALVTALQSLELNPGDEVITTPFTFVATADAILRLGGVPVFVDVEPDTLLLDPDRVEAAITPRTRGILPVHLFGQCADMDRLGGLAVARGLWILEDVAQAMGARWRGRQAGTVGAAGCFSFFPSKNLGALGDAGMVVTKDGVLADRVRWLRAHGAKRKYHHDLLGGNYRLDALQAAVLRVKLPRLEAWNLARGERAVRYDHLLRDAGLSGTGRVVPLGRAEGSTHVFHQYVVRARDRDGLLELLAARGIGHAVYYPVPLHLQGCMGAHRGRPGDLPVAERAAAEVVALPIFPGLTDGEQERVVEVLLEHAGHDSREGP